MIRRTDFVTPAVFERAVFAAGKKRPALYFKRARLGTFNEGLCVQIMHIGPYSGEQVPIDKIGAYIAQNGLVDACGEKRRHHEIRLSDPRRMAPEKQKTVIRHPVSKKGKPRSI